MHFDTSWVAPTVWFSSPLLRGVAGALIRWAGPTDSTVHENLKRRLHILALHKAGGANEVAAIHLDSPGYE